MLSKRKKEVFFAIIFKTIFVYKNLVQQSHKKIKREIKRIVKQINIRKQGKKLSKECKSRLSIYRSEGLEVKKS